MPYFGAKSAALALILLTASSAHAQFAVGPAADLNGDGKPDLVTTNFNGNSVTVLLGNGSGGFAAATGSPFAVGPGPQSVAIGDFNGDGKPDIVTANFSGNNVSVLLGNGSGGFTAAPGSPVMVGAAPAFVAVGDFNGDGKLDIVTANSGDNTITVLLGDGLGSFMPAAGSPLAVGVNPASVAVRDFNGDGKLDIATANYADNTVTVLLGDGLGSFMPAAGSPFAAGANPASVAVGDFNGDGNLDLVTANSADNTVTVLLGDGLGSFMPAAGSPFATGANPVSITVADFNGDGNLDFATSNAGGNTITEFLGDGLGSFMPAAGSPFAVGSNPASMALGDFNLDGKPDLAIANRSDGAVTVLLNSLPAITANPASLTFYARVGQPAPAAIPVTVSGPAYAASSNQPWLATGSSVSAASLTAGVYAGTVRYNAPGFFGAATAVAFIVTSPSGALGPAAASPFAVGAGPQSLAVGDFNGDGNPDIATANSAGNSVTVLLGDGAGGFTPSAGSPFAVGVTPQSVALGDFNGDGNLDLVTANSADNTVTVLLGDGLGSFMPAAGSPFAVGTNPQSVAAADFNLDGKLDLVTANNGANDLTVLLGDGLGGFAPAPGSPIPVGLFPQAVAVGDFNGDGNPDIVTANSGNNTAKVLLGNGSGGFAGGGAFPVGSFPHSVAVADVNGDGKPDIVLANSGGNTVTVLLGNGAGGFTAAAGSPFPVATDPQSVAIADINGDGKPDIVTANVGGNSVTVLLGNGSGVFTAATGSPFAAGTTPISVAAADFNGDGRPDLAIANIGANAVTVLLGMQAATSSVLSTTAAATVAYGTSVPLTLVVKGGFDGTPAGTGEFLDGGISIGAAVQTASPWAFTAAGLAAGIHTLTAAYGGGPATAASTSNTISITVTAATQTITFAALSNQPFGGAPFSLTATASSGLAVTFTSTTLPVCTVALTTVTLVSAGTCTIQATQPGDTNHAAAPMVSQSFPVTLATQTITFAALSSQALGAAPFAVSATASSGLAVSFTSTTLPVCTVSGATVTILIAGTCTIQATQTGNSSYSAAPSVSQHFTVTAASQTITFAALSNQALGAAPFTVSATATSDLAVSFTSTTAPVCTVTAASVTLVSTGTCTIQATQPGNSTWAAAPSVSQHFTVTPGSQTITFGALSDQPLGTAPFMVSATASSSLTVVFTSTTLPVCTVATVTVKLLTGGTCTIQAAQAGNSTYAAATPVLQSFSVTPGSQTITFGALSNKAVGTPAITVTATASSSAQVSFASNTSAVCTISGAIVSLVSAGTCTIEASQAGNANYAAATPVDQSFTVTPGSQTITFAALSNQSAAAAPFTLTATASSGLPVSFTSTTLPVCTVSGATVTLVIAGTCTIQAAQAGSTNYAAAPSISQHFTVTASTQTITFGPLSNQALGTAPVTVNATASSGLAVSFTSTSASVCTVAAAVVTLVSTGACTIQATQGGNGSYAAAPSVSQKFTIAPAAQTITFAALPDQTFGAAPITVSATASSGLSVVFTSTTLPVCTVTSGTSGTMSGATVKMLIAGTCTIQAAQAGNSGFAPAAPVFQTFTVNQEVQTVTFATLPDAPFGTAPFTVTATSTSLLPVTFASTTSAVCTVAAAKSAATVTLVSVGECTIEAAQAGTTGYAPATPVEQTFRVTQASQTITFGALANKAFGAAPFAIAATASSGLAVTFASNSGVCTISGSTVTLAIGGTCTIQASQPGNSNYTAAPAVPQSFTVTPASQIITFAALPTEAFGTGPVTLTATASSGLGVSFASTSSSVCTISGATVTMAGAGTCIIQATQPGNSNYAAAPSVSQNLIVTAASQTITFGAISNQTLGTGLLPLSASASSGLAVVFKSTTLPVCTISGATATLLIKGTCSIQATQPGNTSYAAATPVGQSFTVAAGTLTIGSVLNAGSYAAIPIASDAYTVAFGTDFSSTAAETPSLTFPTTLAGATVTVADSNGLTLPAPLFYVSPTQINFLVPEGLANGSATVTVTNPAGGKVSLATTVAQVSPSLFTADSSGKGVPSAISLTYAGGASAAQSAIITAAPIDLGPPSTTVYLELYGTGIRGRTDLSGVSVTLGGTALQVTFAGAQGTFAGLDQVNVLLDRSLIGRGLLTLQLTVDGAPANPVTVSIQ